MKDLSVVVLAVAAVTIVSTVSFRWGKSAGFAEATFSDSLGDIAKSVTTLCTLLSEREYKVKV